MVLNNSLENNNGRLKKENHQIIEEKRLDSRVEKPKSGSKRMRFDLRKKNLHFRRGFREKIEIDSQENPQHLT